MPNDNALWGEVVGAMVKHYKDLGHTGWYWEVWNEPDLGLFWAGTQAQYNAMYRAVADVVDACSPLTGLVNNAGAGGFQPLLGTDLAGWRRTMEVDLDGAILCLRAAAHGMVRAGVSGSIVNVSSVNARFAHRGFGPYAAAKAGLDQLTRVAALELSQAGIRINGMASGAVDTPMLAAVAADETRARELVEAIPLGRVATTEDYAEALLPEAIEGTLDASALFEFRGSLDDVPAGYQAMHQRNAIKALIRTQG